MKKKRETLELLVVHLGLFCVHGVECANGKRRCVAHGPSTHVQSLMIQDVNVRVYFSQLAAKGRLIGAMNAMFRMAIICSFCS